MSTLSRLLHVAHGIPSYHNSLLALAERLRDSGIELLVASSNDLFNVLDEAGFEFVRLSSDTELETNRQNAMKRCRKQHPPGRWINQYQQSRHFKELSLHTSELQELIEHWKPDLLLIDMECHKAIIQVYSKAVPILLLSRWYTVFRQGNNPPMHTRHRPPTKRTDGFYTWLAWFRLRWHKRRLALRYYLSRQQFQQVSYECNARPALKALAKAQGLSASALTDTSHWLIPHVYTVLPVMSFTHKAMEFTSTNDARMNYVGAMLPSRDAYHPLRDTAITKLAEFLDARRHSGNPMVYCSLSTFWDTQQELPVSIIELFSRRQDIDLVMGLGGRQIQRPKTTTTDNMLMLDYAPQLAVLTHAQIAITHGGVSTINEALMNGVSLIVCSSGHVDQNGCEARVVHHGVGVSCQANPLDLNDLEKNIDLLLSPAGDNIRKNVSAMQYQIKKTQMQFLDIKLLQSEASQT